MINRIDKIQKHLFIFCPLFFILGPFISNLFVVLISILFLISIYLKKNYSIFKNNYFYFFLIFYFYIVIRSFFSENFYFSLEASLFYFRFFIFSFAICYCLSLDEKIKKQFLNIFLLCITFLFFDSIFQYYFKYNIFQMPLSDSGRVSSIFGKELIMGGYSVKFLPIAIVLVYLIHQNIKNQIMIFTYLFLVIFSLVLFSGERTSFAIFLIILFFFILSTNLRIFKYSVLFVVSLVFIFSLISQSIFNRMYTRTYQQIFDENKTYLFSIHHQAHYINASKIFLDKPIFGIGPKNFRVFCKEKKYSAELISKSGEVYTGCQTHPHNIYLQLLAETGFVGFLFILSFFLIVVYKLFKNTFLDTGYNHNKPILIFSLTAVIINLIPFLPSGNFFGSSFNFIFFLSIGFLLSINKNKQV